jgi:hypothetical protein
MVREGRNRRTLTMTTRSEARARAMYRLDSEYTEYSFERAKIGARVPNNRIVNKIRRKQYILSCMGELCERLRDHLLFPDIQYDRFALECVNAVCDGKPNAFSAEHPVLATYIKNTFDREIVTADIGIRTLQYSDPEGVRPWIHERRYLSVNGRRVRCDDAFHMLYRGYSPGLLKNARVVTTYLKDGTFIDSKCLSLRALRLSPKKRTK